jgi:hypothetical protein
MATLTRPPDLIRSAFGRWQGSAEALLAEVVPFKHDLAPFADETVALCEAISTRLMAMRAHPEAVALGFWMRPAALARLRAAFEKAVPSGQLAVPRGLAFHVTPANVDTIFVYSWVVSLLVGNANIVRLSSRTTEARTHLLEAIEEVLADPAHTVAARRNRFVLTDHDEGPLRALSAACDVRVVWGGDATVELLRRFGIPVRGRDVVFPDRHSLAALDASSVAALDEDGTRTLAERFYDDAFWFDQGACSSPRLVIWRAATDAQTTERAVVRFRDAVLAATRRRGYAVETGIALNKMAFATELAARIGGIRIESVANEAMWVRLSDLTTYERENCGGGLFFEFVSDDLAADLTAVVALRDQTVTTFGFAQAELEDLARRINGRGVDRFVPVGRALAFDSTWDGVDLLTELSRRVVVEASGPASRRRIDSGA